jgi:signal transduction histidine kinase/CheY-like chemotaxis protein
VVLISGALLTSGLVEAYFVYEENQAAVIRLQRERAVAAASTIEQFLRETERVLGWVVLPSPAGALAPEQRRLDYDRLLQLAPSIQDVRYVDATGAEQVSVSRQAQRGISGRVDGSQESWLADTRSRGVSYGAVRFADDGTPVLPIALAERGSNPGVVVALLSLEPVWDAITQESSSESGRTYVVDAEGRLIAHPDAGLVRQGTDLSSSPQVRAVRAGPFEGRKQLGSTEVVDALAPSVMVVSQFNPSDQWVHGSSRDWLVAYKVIEPPGWIVFVDQPLDQAFALVRESITRTALLLLLGLVPAVLASVLLVRRMLTPLRALQAGAARIGEGALDQRIDVRTGDEIETLADQFNAMAAQLQESYADLEQKVEDRTREVEEKSRELELASQHKSEFLANMSHELRTPLNAIIGFSEVLTERMFGELNERQEEYLHDILSSGRHLLSLINDILDLSKVEAGRMELELGRFSLAEALENGLTMLRERAGNHGIELRLEVDPAIDEVEADERKVKQIVFNLLSNAVKFTPDGGQVDLSARIVDGVLTVAVRDTGIGIAPEEQARVFEEFRQAGQPAPRQQEGTGLGLALVKRFVELHGGEIRLESEIGAGSTFTFTLPRALRPAPAPSEPVPDPAIEPPPGAISAPSPNGATPRPTVLVVEDDPASVSLLTLHLGAADFEVAVAGDGASGLELARRLRPRCIVLDIMLPGLDGWDVLARAKDDPVLQGIPIVVVSMLDERGKGFALGAADYLLKPISAVALLATIERVARPPERPATLLVVDDDLLAIELMRVSLEPEGYSLLTASGGAEAIELARRALPNLIILDLVMPEVNGFTVVEELRADPRTAEIPIVVLTSKTMTAEDKARLNGRISHLAGKGSFDRAAFLALVRGLCPVGA